MARHCGKGVEDGEASVRFKNLKTRTAETRTAKSKSPPRVAEPESFRRFRYFVGWQRAADNTGEDVVRVVLHEAANHFAGTSSKNT